MSADIGTLMTRIGRGDDRAFGELYDELAPTLYGVVLRVVRDPSQAEEVTKRRSSSSGGRQPASTRLAAASVAGP